MENTIRLVLSTAGQSATLTLTRGHRKFPPPGTAASGRAFESSPLTSSSSSVSGFRGEFPWPASTLEARASFRLTPPLDPLGEAAAVFDSHGAPGADPGFNSSGPPPVPGSASPPRSPGTVPGPPPQGTRMTDAGPPLAASRPHDKEVAKEPARIGVAPPTPRQTPKRRRSCLDASEEAREAKRQTPTPPSSSPQAPGGTAAQGNSRRADSDLKAAVRAVLAEMRRPSGPEPTPAEDSLFDQDLYSNELGLFGPGDAFAETAMRPMMLELDGLGSGGSIRRSTAGGSHATGFAVEIEWLDEEEIEKDLAELLQSFREYHLPPDPYEARRPTAHANANANAKPDVARVCHEAERAQCVFTALFPDHLKSAADHRLLLEEEEDVLNTFMIWIRQASAGMAPCLATEAFAGEDAEAACLERIEELTRPALWPLVWRIRVSNGSADPNLPPP